MTGSRGYAVPSIERALTVLEFLAHSRRGFSISEMSRRLGIPKSSTHLILTTLERRGFLQKNTQTGRYCFGLQLVSLSRSALENLDLREEAKPFLQSLMRKTGLTVHLAVLERNEAVIIEKVEAPGLLKLATWIGRRLDVNCTGVGKALIAFLPEDEFDRLIRAKSFARHNDRTIISISAMKRELAGVRQLGYAFDDEEDEVGLRCVGAPIFDANQKTVAAVSVAGTTSQIPVERVSALATTVKQAAEELSARLGRITRESAGTDQRPRTRASEPL
jgi:DNA-binding IclR family transcriptional regulator